MNPGTDDFISSMFSESCVWLKKKRLKKNAAPPLNLAMHFQQFPGISLFDASNALLASVTQSHMSQRRLTAQAVSQKDPIFP